MINLTSKKNQISAQLIRNQTGSTMVYVIMLAAFVMAGAKYFMEKNQNLSRELAHVSDRAQYHEMATTLKNQLYDSAVCSEALKDTVIMDDPNDDGVIEVGTDTIGNRNLKKITFDAFTDSVLRKGKNINSIKIADIAIETVDKLRGGEDITWYEPEETFKAYAINVYIVPEGVSDIFSLRSEFFRDNYAIPLVAYVDGANNKIKACFGAGSAGDLCTRMGGAYNTSPLADLPQGIRCQPDERCLTSDQGVVGLASKCSSPYEAVKVGADSKYMCMWCPKEPSSGSGGSGGGGYGGGGYGGGGGSGGSGGCFVEGTSISMGDGSLKAIESVKPGDIVMTPEHGPAKVLNAMTKNFKGYVYSINGSPYFVTSNHPIKTVEGWKAFNPKLAKLENPDLEITQLGLGDVILTEKGAEMLIKYDGKYSEEKVYNINVDGPSEYIADGYAVHNKEVIGPSERL